MLILVISAILVYGFLQYNIVQRRKGDVLYEPNMSWFWIKWSVLLVFTFTFISVAVAKYDESYQLVVVDDVIAPIEEYQECYNAYTTFGIYCEKKIVYTNNEEYMRVQFCEQQSTSESILFNKFKETTRVKITLYINH